MLEVVPRIQHTPRDSVRALEQWLLVGHPWHLSVETFSESWLLNLELKTIFRREILTKIVRVTRTLEQQVVGVGKLARMKDERYCRPCGTTLA